MKKQKQILAWVALLILGALYITTFIASIFQSDFSSSLFLASFYSTIFLPVMMYVYLFVYKAIKKNDSSEEHE